MDIEKAVPENKREWNQFVAENYPPAGGFMQSWEWGDFQEAFGRTIGRFFVVDRGKRIAAFMVVRYMLPFGLSYGYVPRGPAIIKNIGREKTADLFNAIKDWAKRKLPDLIFLRLEPPLRDLPPAIYHSGFSVPPYYIQPRHNAVVSLVGSQEEVIGSFHSSTRSNIHRAEKRGVTVTIKTEITPADYTEFSHMKKDTIARNSGKNAYPSDHYFRSFLASIPIVENSSRDEDTLSLTAFYGYHDGVPASAHFVLFFGDTATYLYGATRTAHLNSKVDTYLHWSAMLEAKRRGYKYYDLGGIDGKKWPSLTGYKRQFRGKEISYVGNADVPLRKLLYYAYTTLRKFRN